MMPCLYARLISGKEPRYRSNGEADFGGTITAITQEVLVLHYVTKTMRKPSHLLRVYSLTHLHRVYSLWVRALQGEHGVPLQSRVDETSRRHVQTMAPTSRKGSQSEYYSFDTSK